MNRLDGRIDPARIAAPGAVVGDTLVWDGVRFKPGAGGGDSTHPGAGEDSVAIGAGSEAGEDAVAIGVDAVATSNGVSLGRSSEAGEYNLAVGASANAFYDFQNAAAVGNGASVNGDYGAAFGHGAFVSGSEGTALGGESHVTADDATAVGGHASATAARAIAIGKGAASTTADRGVVKVNDLELVRSNGSGATTVILADSTGTRWRIGVDTSGNPVGLGAA
jgi:hypothetical protein